MAAPDTICDPTIPDEVIIRYESPEPITDSTLGISIAPHRADLPTPPHRLVTIGDSLTQGFQSGAIFNTNLSFPATIAQELGWFDEFTFPHYSYNGGLPVNIEFYVRELEQRYGVTIDPWELPLATFTMWHTFSESERYWLGPTVTSDPVTIPRSHNLGAFGYDLRDALSLTRNVAHEMIDRQRTKKLGYLGASKYISALSVLPLDGDKTVLDAAKDMGDEGIRNDDGTVGDGIETLIITLGANNALGTVMGLNLCWSGTGYDDVTLKNECYNIWKPSHFEVELKQVADKVRQIKARHVIWATVPHVTIAPLANGYGDKMQSGMDKSRKSRFFSYYKYVWVADKNFDPRSDAHITGEQARAVDSAIDMYNDAIAEMVKAERLKGTDWQLFDLCGLLERMAYRRYLETPDAQPKWWPQLGNYRLPDALLSLDPIPDTRFFSSDIAGRKAGGLFSLDGIHPTTIGYGVVAQEMIRIMETAGVVFCGRDGKTARSSPVAVDFNRLIARDTLIGSPPRSISSDLKMIGWFNESFDLFKRGLGHG